jgi:UDP-glucose 4-epimerase
MKNIDVVYHAAALKQVPNCEFHPFEAVKTNVVGAENVRLAAIKTG